MSTPAEPRVFSVTELNELVNDTLNTHINTILVEGEISGLTIRQGKWMSFDLRDTTSSINCFAVKFRVGTAIEDGMRVRILGTPKIYVPYGKYSLNVVAVEPVGEGGLRRAYELLLKTLESEGLFAQEHKQAIPEFPERIGIITSPDGAALGDVRRVLTERWGGFSLVLAPVAVQGRTAAAAVAQAIQYFNQREPVSTIIVTRGGGSLEDLQAFNDERVARAIYASRIPVIAAIGHEQDITIAELVADHRAATPSNAAQVVVPDRSTIALRLDTVTHRAIASIANRTQRVGTTLIHAAQLLERLVHSARNAVEERATRLTGVINLHFQSLKNVRHGITRAQLALHQIATQRFSQSAQLLDQRAQLVGALSPNAVLGRGYSFTVDTASGSIIRSTADSQPGRRLTTHVSDGTISSEVLP